MATTSISHLFPPERINELSTWRFVLHYKAPAFFRDRKLKKALAKLKSAELKAVRFPQVLDSLRWDVKNKTIGIPIEVPPDRRNQPNSLEDYEGDFWRITGLMIGCGFGDLFYEAVDWNG